MKTFIQTALEHRTFLSRRNVIIIVLFVIGLILFLSVYDGVKEHEDLASLDAPLLAWVVANQNPQVTTVLQVVTDVMSPIGITIITLLGAAIWTWRRKDYWRPALTVGAVAVAFVASAIIKTFTARERPTLTDLAEANAAISYSFPSGHTIGVAVLLLVLAYFFCRHKPTPRRIVIWAAIIVSGIALVAFSRIYLGYHWLTDVSASVGLAIIILAIVIAVDSYKLARQPHTTSKVV
jgi:membrane-associated phospholipid phosphatase